MIRCRAIKSQRGMVIFFVLIPLLISVFTLITSFELLLSEFSKIQYHCRLTALRTQEVLIASFTPVAWKIPNQEIQNLLAGFSDELDETPIDITSSPLTPSSLRRGKPFILRWKVNSSQLLPDWLASATPSVPITHYCASVALQVSPKQQEEQWQAHLSPAKF